MRPLLSERMEEVFLLKRTPPEAHKRPKCNTRTSFCNGQTMFSRANLRIFLRHF